MIDFNSIINNIINVSENIIIMESNGFIFNTYQIQRFNYLFILEQLKDLYENANTDKLVKEKIEQMYNYLLK